MIPIRRALWIRTAVAIAMSAAVFALLSPASFADSLSGQTSTPPAATADQAAIASTSLTPAAASVLKSPGDAAPATASGISSFSPSSVTPTFGSPSGASNPPSTVAAATIEHPAGPAEAAVGSEVRATIDQILSGNTRERARYAEAAAKFPSFCQDWARMLHDREVNNLDHLSWQERNGYQTASYTGYGKIESCECKESEGIPIAKVSYQEITYYLAGKTVDDAKHAVPKLVGQVNTLEIFSWEKDKWFY
jgi:hypothetical protein